MRRPPSRPDRRRPATEAIRRGIARFEEVLGRLVVLARGAGAGLGRGQGLVEYGLILSLSAVLAVVLLVFFGGTVSAVLDAVGDAIDAAS